MTTRHQIQQLGRVVMFSLMLVTMTASGNQPSLAPCPDTPNCVSSLADEESKHFIEPIVFTGPAELAWQRLMKTVNNLPRFHVTNATDHYLQAEVISLIFRFVDDVAFLLQPEQSLIHVRSASRIGYSDLGVNRRRIETIRGKMQPAPQPSDVKH